MKGKQHLKLFPYCTKNCKLNLLETTKRKVLNQGTDNKITLGGRVIFATMAHKTKRKLNQNKLKPQNYSPTFVQTAAG